MIGVVSLVAFAVSAFAQNSTDAVSSTGTTVVTTTTATATSAATTAGTSASSTSTVKSGDVCTTSDGGSISIITPLLNEVETAGGSLSITWSVLGYDYTFDSSKISFGVVDATNPDDAIPIANSYIVQNVTVSDGSAKGPVPSVLVSGKSYGVRSEYLDGSTWRYCYSPVFTVAGGSVASSTTKTAATASTISSSAQSVAGIAIAVSAVAALLF
ncbi:hypothetical protein HK100_000190 [Physocladia obscura]|uniref:Uncharacterized protein n=1 Tax=Physocladia obscura TaxID=109957 RepID=A0AAD5SYU7_9FUNG|nr:hypothetical protein HK100_000190 [Physocladia obscura]